MISLANEMIIAEERKKKENDPEVEEEDSEVGNSGKLLLDATCIPADIRYSTDLSLYMRVEKSWKRPSMFCI